MNFSSKEQLAGIARIDFYILPESSNWPKVLTDANAGTVVFDVTAAPEEVDGSIEPESIAIDDNPKMTAAGETWPIEIKFRYLFRGQPMEQLLDIYKNRPGVVVACFNDGCKKLFGSDQEPLEMIWSNLYGDRPEDRHGVQVTISGTTSQRPVYYNPE